MNLQLVIFDLAGTTVEDYGTVNKCFRETISATRIDIEPQQINQVMGMAKPDAIRQLLFNQYLGEESELEKLVSSLTLDFEQRMIDYYQTNVNVREVDGATSVFHLLRKNNVKVALTTGFSRVITQSILERLEWNNQDLINVSIASDEVEHGRPRPDLGLRAMTLTGVTDASKVACVGDTPSDLEHGKNLNAGYIVGVTYGTHQRSELIDYPHTHLIDNLTALPCLFYQKPKASIINSDSFCQ